LVSLVLLSYNQEEYIEAALRGLFAQDYANLEIVISDDCSPDATFELITRACSAYRGPHTVRTNRNPCNLGLGAHVNHAMGLVHGELVVVAAGDDISDTRRVSLLTEAWEAAERPPALCSQAAVIARDGELLAERFDGYDGRYPEPGEPRSTSILRLLQADHCLLLGCTEAWTPRVFEVFGPLDAAVVHEDNAVSLRAWLLGGIVFLPTPLVQYRTHLENIAHRVRTVPRGVEDFSRHESAYAARQCAATAHLRQHAADLDRALSLRLVSAQEYLAYSVVLARRLCVAQLQAKWWQLPLRHRLRGMLNGARSGGFPVVTWCLPRLAGLRLFSLGRAYLGLVSRKVRSVRRRLSGGALWQPTSR
jgi:glycosyltransferase involved in cell wall biosynthesis